VLGNQPLLSVDELVERIDAVTIEDLRELADELLGAERLSAAGIGPDEGVFRQALEGVSPALAVA
jgi:predicted Zn-dependent peptidase